MTKQQNIRMRIAQIFTAGYLVLSIVEAYPFDFGATRWILFMASVLSAVGILAWMCLRQKPEAGRVCLVTAFALRAAAAVYEQRSLWNTMQMLAERPLADTIAAWLEIGICLIGFAALIGCLIGAVRNLGLLKWSALVYGAYIAVILVLELMRAGGFAWMANIPQGAVAAILLNWCNAVLLALHYFGLFLAVENKP